MDTLTKPALRALREDIDEALSGVALRHDLTVKLGGCTFSSDNATFKLEVAVNGDGGPMTKEATDFQAYATRYGLAASDLFSEIEDSDGERYKIVGCKPRSTKYPVLVERLSDGKVYKFPGKRAADALARARTA